MAPSVAENIITVSLEHASPAELDTRPSKRPRKGGSTRDVPEEASPSAPAQLDHIFIADGIVAKKGGKKTPLSCAECRRLKLRCDRVFPCASCKKRGCAEICPEGVLVSGKGTRFILANTEQLHSKIIEMSDRIRSLEEALEELHSSINKDTHPLLATNELLNIKSTMGLYGGAQKGGNDVLGGHTSSTPSDGGHDNHADDKPGQMDVDPTRFDYVGQSDQKRQDTTDSSSLLSSSGPHYKGEDKLLTPEIMRLSDSFPISGNVSPEPNPKVREFIRSKLPARHVAEHLWEQAKQNALWQYNPHPNETFLPNLINHVYTSSIHELCPRRLSLLLMIMAVGTLVDLTEPPYQHSASSLDALQILESRAEQYHHLARAALCEIPVMEETNIDTIIALFYEIWYLLVFSDRKKAAGYAFGLMGLTAKLAQSIGLHRDGVKSKMIPEEVEKRRSLFWELLYLDARLSLSLGRPPSLIRHHVDCKRPSYTPVEGCDPAESLHFFQEWKHSSYISCLSPVLELISGPPSSLDYAQVIELDTRIREFTVPPPLRSGATHSRQLMMQKASLSTALEAVLLQLHRTFFTRALSGPERAFNRRHPFAPSVVAVFLSASRMIATVEALFRREPNLTSRILAFWSNAFSAAVALCLLVSRAPFTCLSPAALQELERARILFEAAKDTCPRAMQVIPILDTLVLKANHIYTRWAEGDDVPSLALRHTLSDDPTQEAMMQQINQQPSHDSFANAHRSLSQCIAEVHQRAMILFPSRKPCQCAQRAQTNRATPCPPSHSWSPPPKLSPSQTMSPVLPDLYDGSMLHGVLPGNGPGITSINVNLNPSSRMAVVESINFDFGALNQTWNDGSQNWMAWF
ncbi:Zinc cluster transcription factor 30 [Pleurotus pulmonarius]